MIKEKILHNIKTKAMLICMLGTILILAGCSVGTPNADRIKNDLNANEIANSEEFLEKTGTKDISVSKVSIVDKNVERDECEIKSNVVLQNKNYKIDAQITAYYSKFDKWNFKNYKIGEYTISPTSGVPDYIVKQRAEYIVATSVGALTENAQVTNVIHTFDANKKTDYVTFDLSAKGNVSKVNIKADEQYEFEDHWRIKDTNDDVTSIEWLYNDLENTSWSGTVGIGASRYITINSVDAENKLMNVSYYSHQDDCTYELTDWQGIQAIKVYLPHESFTDEMWIFANGTIRYGKPGGLGGMLGKVNDETSNNAKNEVVISESEKTTDSNDEELPIDNENKSFPIIPIAIIVVVIIVIAVIRKISKKTASKIDETPFYDDTPIYKPGDLPKPTPPVEVEKNDDWFKPGGDL